MKFCSHCGKQLDDDAAFCSACGANQLQATAQSVFCTTQKQETSGKGKALGITSFCLSLFSFLCSIITFCGGIDALGYWEYEEAAAAIGIVVAVIACPILSLVFSNMSQEENNKAVLPKLGKVFGIISIILLLISLLLSIIVIADF